MIQNKQVNRWRGSDPPPTIYHIWIKDESKLLLYNGTEWVTFIDSTETIQIIQSILDRLDSLEGHTINNKKIVDNPVLSGSDIKNTYSGTFVSNTNSISDALSTIDKLITTQIIL